MCPSKTHTLEYVLSVALSVDLFEDRVIADITSKNEVIFEKE